MIQAARTPQEIGCHSFSHVDYGDPDLTREAVDADLEACVDLASKRGITLRSFVFPGNVEGHHEALKAHGFRAYRGADPSRLRGLPRPIVRAARLVDHAVGFPPPVSKPYEKLPGLWNIPGSSLFPHRSGLRQTISSRARLRRARAGMRRAEATGSVFHLWTHPFNLASDRPYLVRTLDVILRDAAAARAAGRIAIESMAVIADRLASASVPAPTGEDDPS
jgi:hypothetical protein